MNSKLLILFFIIIMASCSRNPFQHQPIRLAMSKATENYINWIHRIDSTVQIFDLYTLPEDSAVKIMRSCHGILFTGGEDVNPAFYRQPADTVQCEMDKSRDSLEFSLIRVALKKKIPILGICRGLQILNVAMGGTLVVDIPTDYPTTIPHKCEDYTKCHHPVKITDNTLLKEVSKSNTGWVNTNHHQAIATPGKGLKISARSDDGLPEAIEWADPKDKGYLMAVQWHPERMEKDNPLSDPLARAFLQACLIRMVLQ